MKNNLSNNFDKTDSTISGYDLIITKEENKKFNWTKYKDNSRCNIECQLQLNFDPIKISKELAFLIKNFERYTNSINENWKNKRKKVYHCINNDYFLQKEKLMLRSINRCINIKTEDNLMNWNAK